jgi:hypothetical protein
MTALLFHNIVAGLVLAWAGADPGTPTIAPGPDVCALLTEAEAEEILGKQLPAPQPQSTGDCWYTTEPGSMGEIILSVLPVQFKSKDAFHAFLLKETNETNARIKKAMEKSGVTVKETVVEPVPEVGAPAYYAEPGLFVLIGTQVLGIYATREQAVAVAAKAVPRFR